MRAGLAELSSAEALSALAWWRDAGVDLAIDEAPRNWLARTPRSSPSGRGVSPGLDPGIREGAVPPSALPATLAALHHWFETADTLPDGSPRGRRLLPQGDPASGWMVLIDCPEPDDRAALLEGAEGRLLEAMLAAIGLSRSAVYLASVYLARPLGPRADVAALALHHVALAAPRRLLLIGEGACQALTGLNLASARGRAHPLEPSPESAQPVNLQPGIAVATIGLRTLLQRPLLKREAWKDLRLAVRGMTR